MNDKSAIQDIKFSIVIPCYNAEATIMTTLQSCLAQSYPPHEIIIINDASTDTTAPLLDSIALQHPQIKVIHLSVNHGVAASRNKGWDIATGDFITFLDSDDSFHSDKLKVLFNYITHYGSHVYWHPYSYTLPGEKIEVSIPHIFPPVQLTHFNRLLLSSPVSTCTLVVPKYWKVRFDNNMRYCEDHDFILRSAFEEPLVHIPLSLTFVHRKINSKGGLSGHLWAMRKGEIYMYHKLHRLKWSFIFLQPLFYIYSLLKHVRLLIMR